MAGGTQVVCSGCKLKATKWATYVRCMGECGLLWHMKCAEIVDSGGVVLRSFVAAKWSCKTCDLCEDSPAENNNGEPAAPRDDGEIAARLASLESVVRSLVQDRPVPCAESASQVPTSAKIGPKGPKDCYSSVAALNCEGKNAGVVGKQLDINVAADEEGGWDEVSSRQKRSRRDTTHDIFVETTKPGEKEATRKIVKEALSEKIRRDHVLDVKTTTKGVIVCCRDEDGKRAVSAVFQERESERLQQRAARVPPPRLRRVCVMGAYLDDFPDVSNMRAESNKEFVLTEAKANNLPEKSEIAVVAILQSKPFGRKANKDEMVRIVLAVDENTRKYMKENNLQIGYKSCTVLDHSEFKVCYKCRGYGHHSDRCAREKPICINCAGDDHTALDCTVDPADYKCVNCCNYNKKGHENKMQENHIATSRECESYKRAKIACLKKRDQA